MVPPGCGLQWEDPASCQSQGELVTMALFLRDRAVLLSKSMEIVHTGSETQIHPRIWIKMDVD